MDHQQEVIAIERALAALRWLSSRARRSLRQVGFPGVPTTGAWADWYNALYRNLSERALQSGQPKERVPELLLHDIEGYPQQLSRC
jgi:hypothetical protein